MLKRNDTVLMPPGDEIRVSLVGIQTTQGTHLLSEPSPLPQGHFVVHKDTGSGEISVQGRLFSQDVKADENASFLGLSNRKHWELVFSRLGL